MFYRTIFWWLWKVEFSYFKVYDTLKYAFKLQKYRFRTDNQLIVTR